MEDEKDLETESDVDNDDIDDGKPPRGARVNKWTCPECKQTTTFYVGLSEPPTCQNPEDHLDKVVKMEPAQ